MWVRPAVTASVLLAAPTHAQVVANAPATAPSDSLAARLAALLAPSPGVPCAGLAAGDSVRLVRHGDEDDETIQVVDGADMTTRADTGWTALTFVVRAARCEVALAPPRYMTAVHVFGTVGARVVYVRFHPKGVARVVLPAPGEGTPAVVVEANDGSTALAVQRRIGRVWTPVVALEQHTPSGARVLLLTLRARTDSLREPRRLAAPGERAIAAEFVRLPRVRQRPSISNYIRVGMTAEDILQRWGTPDHVNSTTTAAGRTEQWVYDAGAYVYFDVKGRVTGFQESR